MCHTAIKRSMWPFFAWPVMCLPWGRVWKENTGLLITPETFHYNQKLQELVSGFFFPTGMRLGRQGGGRGKSQDVVLMFLEVRAAFVDVLPASA